MFLLPSFTLSEPIQQCVAKSQGEKVNIDFDFDIVFRDLAPIDLMRQEIIVDRHNHNNENTSSRSQVYAFAIYDDDSKNYFANRIYGNALIEKTREALLCI